ncbi:MAG TPA: adenylosuccinate lyase [Candidatus Krumholzibacteria bacterium]|nr:adenylosuccinate lyase [Candidatus Krumholzibacteria bacterium]HPD72678.1 adenylosuccinate lyase [Candidatus Krumholzibacteria bacterium]HRY40390.1 adenylosuccinate lyase [Candidatus Krumholzibacteria bacterium]
MIDRYATPEMTAIWSDEARFRHWQEIEVTVCEVRADRGEIPPDAAREIRARATFETARVLEIERTVQHDVIAFLTNLAEHVGPASRFVHQGMTSSDLLDTAFALQIRTAGGVLRAALVDLLDAVEAKAIAHRDTVMMGRSHGVHAEPTTFGLKLLVYWEALRRGLARLDAGIAECSYGKISGAVGTHAHLAPEIEAATCARLGLAAAPVSTQILQRDRHAAFLAAVALVGATLEQMAVEIRNLQRTDVHEVEEPFGKGQKGSSAMPHKKNPIVSEKITGLARLLRGYAHTAAENVALWHERDISHSSVERIVFPDACHTLHHMLLKMRWLVDGLVVFPDQMLANMAKVRGMHFSQVVMLALTEAGVSREDAYAWVQSCAMRVWDEDVPLREAIDADPRITSRLDGATLDRCFDLAHQLRHVPHLFARTLAGKDF